MTDDEIKLIAEAHGWRSMGNGLAYAEHKSYIALAVRNGKSWRLTDAGAFRVLVESKMCLEPVFLLGDESLVPRHSSPHEAVAQARLARLRGKPLE